MRIEVVLPQPDGPTKTVKVPSGTSLDGLVEAVVLYPFSCCLIRVDAGVAGRRGVEFDQVIGRQLGVYGVEYAFQLVGFLLRAHQRNDIGGEEVVLRVLEHDQVVLPDRR